MKNKFLSAVKKSITDKWFLTILTLTTIGNFPQILNEVCPKIEEIKDKSHLEILLNQEKKKLDIEEKNVNINAYFNDTIKTSRAMIIKENYYEVHLAKHQRNLAALRHELYHVDDGHCDEMKRLAKEGSHRIKFLKYLYFYEPKAAIYAATGIKL